MVTTKRRPHTKSAHIRNRVNSCLVFDHLEPRLALSVTITPITNQFEVNSSTATAAEQLSMVAMEPNGDHVVVWDAQYPYMSPSQPEHDEILVQRYSATDQPVGGEIIAEKGSGTSDPQDFRTYPTVAMDSQGDFIVAWQVNYNSNQGNPGNDLYAIRYNWNPTTNALTVLSTGGSTLPFKVNQVSDSQGLTAVIQPVVAMDPGGAFDFTWSRVEPINGVSTQSVWFRVYNSTGAPVTNETRADFTNNSAQKSWIAMDTAGDFIITWGVGTGTQTNPGLYDIYFQRFHASGGANGGKFDIGRSRDNLSHEYGPHVSMDSNGDSVIAWSNDYGFNPSQPKQTEVGAFAKIVTSAGSISNLIVVSDFGITEGSSDSGPLGISPTVSMDPNGNWVCAWSTSNGTTGTIVAQTFNLSGSPTGPSPSTPVSQTIPFHPTYDIYPFVATNSISNGEFSVVWDQAPNPPTSGNASIWARSFTTRSSGSSMALAPSDMAPASSVAPLTSDESRNGHVPGSHQARDLVLFDRALFSLGPRPTRIRQRDLRSEAPLKFSELI